MVSNKFGKQSGPSSLAIPAANSVTTDKIFDGTVAAADIGAKAVTAAKLHADVITTTSGLSGADGAAIAFEPYNCTAAVVAVASDSMIIIDANDANAPRREAIADVVGAVAGTQATSALTAASGVLKVAPADNAIAIAADSLVYATAAGVTKKDLVSDVITAVAGSAAATGLTAAAGVLSVAPTDTAIAVAADSLVFSDATDGATRKDLISDVATAMADGTTISAASGVFSVATGGIGIAQMANDDKASVFFITGEHDFGQNGAKDTDLGALGAKGTLIGGYMVMTEVLNGTDATHTVTLSSAAAGGTPIATAITITKANTADGQSNIIGATRAFAPLAAGIDMASTDHVYAYTAVDGTRTTGIVQIVLMFLKSA